MVFNIKKIKKNNKGFSLMELIVVIFVLATGLLGVLSLATNNLNTQKNNQDRLIASQLAQEGLELVRNIRDSNWANAGTTGDDWDEYLTDGSPGEDHYYIDYSGINDCSGSCDSDDIKLYIKNNGSYESFYSHDSSDASFSGFTREIIIDDSSSDDLLISCVVTWQTGTKSFEYKADTKIYNWK